jgi:hypothetical protein
VCVFRQKNVGSFGGGDRRPRTNHKKQHPPGPLTKASLQLPVTERRLLLPERERRRHVRVNALGELSHALSALHALVASANYIPLPCPPARGDDLPAPASRAIGSTAVCVLHGLGQTSPAGVITRTAANDPNIRSRTHYN